MTRRGAWSVLVLVALAGCEGCASEAAERHGESREQSATGAGGEGRAGEGQAAGGEAGPAPEIAVRASIDRWGRLTVAVENRDREPVRLEREVRTGAEGSRLRLAQDCAAEPQGCVTLVPGAVLYPCECGGCEELPDGAHRFSVRTCGGAHELESAAVAVDR